MKIICLYIFIYFFNLNTVYASNTTEELERTLKQQMELEIRQKNNQLNLKIQTLNKPVEINNDNFIKEKMEIANENLIKEKEKTIEKEKLLKQEPEPTPLQELEPLKEIQPISQDQNNKNTPQENKELTEFEKIQKVKMDNPLNNYDSMSSIFFSTKEAEVIKLAYKVYLKNQYLKDIEEKQEVVIANMPVIEEPIAEDKSLNVVTLNSIMFMNEKNWTIWLNNKKFSNLDNNKNNSEFQVIAINQNKIKLKWLMTMTKFQNFINKKNLIAEERYSINNEGRVEILLDLYVNQSYLSFLDKIVDGKYIPERKKKENKIFNNNNLQNNNNIDNILKDSNISNNLDILIKILMEQLL